MSKAPYSQQKDARQQNASALLRDLWHHAPLSRAMLAQRNDLTKATVSAICDDLAAQNVIRAVGQDRTGNGRPGHLVEINPSARAAIGVEISTNYAAVLLTDFSGKTLWQQSLPSNLELANAWQQAEQLVEEAVAQAQRRKLNLLGIGIGIPGVKTASQRDVATDQQRWEKRFGLPILIDNKARVAALAELLHGSAQKAANFVYISVGTDVHASVDAAVVMNGVLLRGSQGLAVDAGHMILNPQGARCACGQRGCWQAMIDVAREVELAQQRLAAGEASLLQTMMAAAGKPLDHRMIHQAALQHDPLATDVFRQVFSYQSLGILNLIALFDPELVVISYANVALPTEYQQRMQELTKLPGIDLTESVSQQVRQRGLTPPTICMATYGQTACMLGAATLWIDEFLRSPTSAS